MNELLLKGAAMYECAKHKSCTIAQTYSSPLLLAVGTVLIVGGMTDLSLAQDQAATLSASEANFQDELIRGAVGNLFQLIEGAFGALIMVVAGLGAIVAAAMGAYRAAVGMLVVAVGAFILRSLVSLFFGTDFEQFQGQG